MCFALLFTVFFIGNYIGIHAADKVVDNIELGSEIIAPIVETLKSKKFEESTKPGELVAIECDDGTWKYAQLRTIHKDQAAVLMNARHGKLIGFDSLRNPGPTHEKFFEEGLLGISTT